MNDHGLRDDYEKQRVRLSQARHVLADAQSVQQLRQVRDEADAVRTHVKCSHPDLELLNLAAELKLQAERQIGRILIELKLRGGNRRSKGSREPVKLRDLGVDKNQSARWQLEASVPETLFCQFVRNTHASGQEITSASLIRLARRLRKQSSLDIGDPAADGTADVNSLASYLPGPPPPPQSKPQRAVRELTELVLDAQNHNQLVVNLFESLCQHDVVRPDEGVCRALRRYIGEVESHLESIGQGLRRLASHGSLYTSAWSAAATR